MLKGVKNKMLKYDVKVRC